MNKLAVSNDLLQVLDSKNDVVSIHIKNNHSLAKISGTHDENFSLLEKISKTQINLRGNLITIKGKQKDSEIVINVINTLLKKSFDKNDFEDDDIISVYNFETNNVNNENLALEDQISNDDFGIKTPRKTVYARTEKQKKYLEILKKNNIIYAIGPAGTGKTFLPVAVAVNKLVSGEVKKIILSRPAVEAGESLGFLPGDLKDKIDPYLIPLYDSLSELIGHDKMNKKIEDGSIEIAPLAFMRGRTLKDSFVILDEAQNATETQIKMFLTRLGKNTTMVVNGDPTQIDLPNSKVSGLMNSANVLSNIEEIKIVKFDATDVQRHPLVSKIIEAYKKNSLDV
ncbi:MAG: PhoH family protein [Proteobacteria bacterium]|jgi:phosphate starvation-inducible protein PhoH and related proteins|nr:PhoH family protein [Pseudomonadota bacterium]MDA0971535.1 PhoH family protein [Pseudomonadota bacterium]MDA0995877.1 PhoH family protein [Pseudomonadota bacterium]